MRKALPCLRCGARVKLGKRECQSCGKAMALLVADRFELRECFNWGDSAYALVAWDRQDNRDVFIRVTLQTAAPDITNAINAEAQVLLLLGGHAGIPAFIHGGKIRETGGLYLAQEFLIGEPLDKVMHRLPVAGRISLIKHAVASVMPVHETGYVHCAISLKHFIATPDGRVILIDFRRTRRSDSPAGETGMPGYMAPEQLNALNPVTPATDTHALGACAYAALAGTVPFSKKRPKRLGMRWPVPRKPSELSGEITDDFDSVVLQALSYDPAERHQSAREFHQALCASAGHDTVIDGLPYSFPTRMRRVLNTVVAVAIITLRAACVCARSTAKGLQSYGHTLARMTGTRPIVVQAVTAGILFLLTSFLALIHIASSEATAGRNPPEPPNRMSAGSSRTANGQQTSFPVPALVAPATATQTQGMIEFLTWPPSSVYMDGRLIVEAPSPDVFAVPSNAHRIELISKLGQHRLLTIETKPSTHYVLKFDFETGTLDLQETLP